MGCIWRRQEFQEHIMDMQLSEDQKAIDTNVRQLCAEFDDQYWTE